ncbi:hypothetical protein FH966_00840 [Lentibacillus cibarius]|uniref:Uncharacterized protein n=1 Tax=Lentibacillus cibarius TaxID=2583219 RepID=A0A549YET8_9BACI|nr:hypothetical protein [Lentibacillus cibarius]TMN21480.1 hypothetical protein FFL34_04685 [Lentibacillus cibarius]TRM10378.1 hypothetical protein FH966_00840 [Lentibacillus cibarius]
MKKIAFIIITAATVVLPLLMQADWGKQSFTSTLNVDSDHITKLKFSIANTSHYKTTRNHKKIQELLDYMNTKEYEKIKGEPANLPMSGSMIYLYENKKVDYIVVFGGKILVSQQFYEVKKTPIDMNDLKVFFRSVE